MKKTLIHLCAICCAIVISSRPTAAEAAGPTRSKQPNIVVILSDDMGWSQPGFNGGNPRLTPHLDRLATEGMQLNQFYAHSVCAPSRTALMTGRYPFRTWMDWRSEDFGKPEFLARLGLTLPQTPTGVDTRRIHGLDIAERTLGNALQDEGYFTAIIGKWHLGEWLPEHLPLQRGFNHQYGHYAWGVDYYTKMIPHNAPARFSVYDWHRNERPLNEPGYSTDLIAGEAVEVIGQQSADQPFFLYIPFNAVHGPIDSAPRYTEEFGPMGASLKILDEGIGRILAALQENGFEQNTLVVFTNDNGGLTEASNQPLRGKKDTNWEGGVRVSCILRWPDVIAPGTDNDGLMHITDFYPTLLHLAGGRHPEQARPLDGLDMTAMLLQGSPSPRDEILFEVTGSVRVPAIRQGDYKLVGHELYNLQNDPFETTDVAAAHPQIVERLKQRIKTFSDQRPPLGEMDALMEIPLPYIYGQRENRAPAAWLVEAVEAARAQQPQSWAEGETPWPKPPPPIPALF